VHVNPCVVSKRASHETPGWYRLTESRIGWYLTRAHSEGGRGLQNGVVKWFNDAKGYGFIATDEGKDLFVHYSAINMDGRKTLREGDRVEFEVADGPKGPQAANVCSVV